MVRRDDENDLVAQERLGRDVGWQAWRAGADGHVRRPAPEQVDEGLGLVDAELDVQVPGACGEQLEQAWSGILPEQAGGGKPQQAAPGRRCGDLGPGAVLQAEQLVRATREAQAAGGEGQACRLPADQRVPELPAQLGDVEGDRRLGDPELLGGQLEGTQPHDGGIRAQLGRGHRRASGLAGGDDRSRQSSRDVSALRVTPER